MKIEVINNNKGNIKISEFKHDGKKVIYNIDMDFENKIVPDTVILKFNICCDAFSTWSPETGMNHGLGVDFNYQTANSRLASGAPVKAIIAPDGKNVMTLAVSDAKTPLKIETGVHEETGEIECRITFFTLPVSPMKKYHAQMVVDKRNEMSYNTITDAADWWRDDCGYKTCDSNETVISPMYSTWYSFHQNITEEALLSQCRLAKEMGMEAIIIDDGWQTDDNARGYKFCGDWKCAKSKIPDMKDFVKKVHELGMKVILWYSVPFVGTGSEAYKDLKNYALNDCMKDTITLDPRVKCVRDYLLNLYTDALKEWDLDGFKLDFIDAIGIDENFPAKGEYRDIENLEDGIETMLEDITNSLKKIKKDLCIEFRQSYIGPTICRFGNMLRVGDCGYDAIQQRVGMVSLRLTSGKTAVHSDMFMWHMDDTPEHACLQLLNGFFAVPQISVKLDKISTDQRKMLEFYLKLWIKYRDVILNGKMSFRHPESNYSQISSVKDGINITCMYSENLFELDNNKIILLNATAQKEFILKNKDCRKLSISIFDCMGNKVSSSDNTEKAIFEIEIPESGCAVIE